MYFFVETDAHTTATSSSETLLGDQMNVCSSPALDTSAARHGSSISLSLSEGSQPVQNKQRVDIDNAPDGGNTCFTLSECFEPVRTKVPLDIDPKPNDGSLIPTPKEGPQKPPFKCGCGNCTWTSFISGCCPARTSSASSFPYLDTSGLSHKQKQELEERLQFESEGIMMQFQKLVSAIFQSLIRRKVQPGNLVVQVMTLGVFEPMFKDPQVPLLQHRLVELKAADTVAKVFMVLNDYFSFFNYEIVEHIIMELGTDIDKANLRTYEENFDQYMGRRIYECGLHQGLESKTDQPNIIVKLDEKYDTYSGAKIKRFCHKLSETLHLSNGVLRLCRVEKGCVQLTFQVPSFVQQKIFPLSRKQETILRDEGVIKLTCGEYQFLNDGEVSHQKIDASGKLVHVFS